MIIMEHYEVCCYFIFYFCIIFSFLMWCNIPGLEILIGMDERFRNYKNDLFSHRSIELDRELMGIEQNNQLNVSIASYLRLLSGYFLHTSALQTLEYLIRRHKWAVYLISIIQQCCFLPRGVVLIITFWLCLFYLFLWFLMGFVLSFRIHVYNNEDLILCTLPYHDEPEFVRIVQILDTRLERYYYMFLVWLWCRL